jgi:hypothetical protein
MLDGQDHGAPPEVIALVLTGVLPRFVRSSGSLGLKVLEGVRG